MSGKGLAALRALFSNHYHALRGNVARRLGGAGDMAEDALHDAYLRLVDKGGLEDVRHPLSYLVNTAVHVAIDRIRSEARVLSESEVQDFLECPDPAPGPAQIAVERQRLELAGEVLSSLSPRQLDILLAMRVHGQAREEVARRWGISERQVSRELLAAHSICVRAMEEAEA